MYPYYHLSLPSFPTRRSSDLSPRTAFASRGKPPGVRRHVVAIEIDDRRRARPRDRKSTRLNSSHVAISYAVFCLIKKKTTSTIQLRLQLNLPHPLTFT